MAKKRASSKLTGRLKWPPQETMLILQLALTKDLPVHALLVAAVAIVILGVARILRS